MGGSLYFQMREKNIVRFFNLDQNKMPQRLFIAVCGNKSAVFLREIPKIPIFRRDLVTFVSKLYLAGAFNWATISL